MTLDEHSRRLLGRSLHQGMLISDYFGQIADMVKVQLDEMEKSRLEMVALVNELKARKP